MRIGVDYAGRFGQRNIVFISAIDFKALFSGIGAIISIKFFKGEICIGIAGNLILIRGGINTVLRNLLSCP